MNTRVSIVVPVYNSHATLPKCLDSLIAQTYQDIEIICINDCSKDNSLDIIKEYQQKDNRVRLINHEENKNAGGARNSGIKAATGTYVCFVDNDDWLVTDAIETLIEASDDCNIDYVVPQWCEYYSETRKSSKKNLIVGGTKEKNCEYALLHGCRMLGCLIRRDIFFKNKLFYPEKTFFEDNAICISLLYCANKIKVIDRVLYYYQMLEGSSSRSISLQKIKDRIITSRLSVSNLERLGIINDANRVTVNFHYLRLVFYTIQMLAIEGTSEAREQIKALKGDIDTLLPNSYINTQGFIFAKTLDYPVLFYYIWKNVYILKKHTPDWLILRIKNKINTR